MGVLLPICLDKFPEVTNIPKMFPKNMLAIYAICKIPSFLREELDSKTSL